MKSNTLRPVGRLALMLVCVASLAWMSGCAEEAAPGPEVAPERGAEAAAPGDEAGEAGDEARSDLPVGHTPIGALAPPVDYAEGVEGSRDAQGGVDLTPNPDATSRNLRRMSIDQLRGAIATVTGGVYWADNQGRDRFEQLAPSLGVPNYIDITGEDLEPSLVFQKFLGDAARAVCHDTIQNDLAMDAQDRVLLRYADPTWTWESADEAQRAEIDRNLRYLNLRITGHYIAPDDEEGLQRLRWLWRATTHATGDASRGWRAVCVGLISSPEFYLY